MENPERDRKRRVAQVGIEVGEVVGRAERLVRHRPERQGGDVRADDGLGTPAGAVRAQLELVVVEPIGTKKDELLDPRQAGARLVSERLRRDRHRPPPGRRQALGGAGLRDPLAGALVPHEDHGEPASRLRPERLRDRQEHARAVARQAVGGGRPAVADVAEAGEQQVHDHARRAAGGIGDEADATGVAFCVWVVEECAWAHSRPPKSMVGSNSPPRLLASRRRREEREAD